MRVITAFVITCIGAVAAITLWPVNAAQNPASEHVSPVNAELLVFETETCPYCYVFRRDVAPKYVVSPRARDVPLRYIDVRKTDPASIGLNAPLTMLPTIVLMKDGREVDRITGYMGPEPFFHMISRLIK